MVPDSVADEGALTTVGDVHGAQGDLGTASFLTVEALAVEKGFCSLLPQLDPADPTATVKQDPLQTP